MDKDDFNETIARLGYSQVGISRLFGVNDRSGRRWARGEVDIPKAVEIALRLIEKFGLTPEVVAEILSMRMDKKFGDGDTEYHVWVRPRFQNAEWTVAKANRKTKKYLLPGVTSEFELRELELGPRVHLSPVDA